MRIAVRSQNTPLVAVVLGHGQRVGPAPPESLALRHEYLIRAATFHSLGIFRLLVDHVAFNNATDFIELLHTLLAELEVCQPAVRLLLDRYAGTLLSVLS